MPATCSWLTFSIIEKKTEDERADICDKVLILHETVLNMNMTPIPKDSEV